MAADEVNLTFLGEQMKTMQADMRRIDTQVALIREKMVLIEAEQVELRSMLINATGEFTLRMIALERRFDALERRSDRFEASVDARFRQMEETAATNVQILLAAINGRGAPA